MTGPVELAQLRARHLEHAAATSTCPHRDPWCPCQEGDACHHDTRLGPPLWALMLEEVDG